MRRSRQLHLERRLLRRACQAGDPKDCDDQERLHDRQLRCAARHLHQRSQYQSLRRRQRLHRERRRAGTASAPARRPIATTATSAPTTGCDRADGLHPREQQRRRAATATRARRSTPAPAASASAARRPNCNDNNVCTDDSLQCPDAAASHGNNTAPCSDSNECTDAGRLHVAAACVSGAAPNCNDSNACTTDSCDPATGCQHDFLRTASRAPRTRIARTPPVCDGIEQCVAGQCQSGASPDCNDQNACTDDGCNAVTGCTHPEQQRRPRRRQRLHDGRRVQRRRVRRWPAAQLQQQQRLHDRLLQSGVGLHPHQQHQPVSATAASAPTATSAITAAARRDDDHVQRLQHLHE